MILFTKQKTMALIRLRGALVIRMQQSLRPNNIKFNEYDIPGSVARGFAIGYWSAIES